MKEGELETLQKTIERVPNLVELRLRSSAESPILLTKGIVSALIKRTNVKLLKLSSTIVLKLRNRCR